MKVLLVDVDSKIANLALMKIGMFHKMRGDVVELARMHARGLPVETDREPDIAYVSCLFTWNADLGRAIAGTFPKALVGGTGFDHGKPASERAYLSPEIEHAPPDYTLYDVDYAVGFCLRGCNRRCTFCDVPLKEGKINMLDYRPPASWVPEDFKRAMLLDNDMALYDDVLQEDIVGWFRSAGVRWSLTQGWDVRATTPERAARLASCMPYDLKFGHKMLYIAWDYVGIEPWVRNAIVMLKDAGFRGGDITCYMIVGHDPRTKGYTPVGDLVERANALHRFNVLWKEYGVLPYVMPFNNRKDDPWIRSFARYVNRRVFKVCEFEDFDYKKYRRRAA